MKRHLQNNGRRKGQSLIEFALGGILLVMLLAAAVDFGRAFYTYVVVLNMAGEGAAVLALNPDDDLFEYPDPPFPAPQPSDTFQRRAKAVAARVQGRIITPNHVADTDVRVTTTGGVWIPKEGRCVGRQFEVHVTYRMDDLFLPALIGLPVLPISGEATSLFTRSSGGAVCGS